MMEITQAIKEIEELMWDEGYLKNYSGASSEPMNKALDLAIKALGKQIELSEYLKGMEKINDYDTRLVIEVKDLLREFMID